MVPWTTRAGSLVLAATGLFVGICLVTFDPADTPLLSAPPHEPPQNLGGAIGSWIGLLGRGGFGWTSLVVPLWCFLWGWRLWQGHRPEFHLTSLTAAMVCLMAAIGTLLALSMTEPTASASLGGVTGFLLARAGTYYLGTSGTVLAAGGVGVLAWVVISGQTVGITGLRAVRRLAQGIFSPWRRATSAATQDHKARGVLRGATVAASTPARDQPWPAGEEPLALQGGQLEASAIPAPPQVRIRSTVTVEPKRSPPSSSRVSPNGFRCPSLDVLADPPPILERQIADDLQTNAQILEETLREFGVEAHVVNVDRGPTVTRYEVKPAAGVKLTKIVSLADELALMLKTVSCHIVAPIPGKGLVGIDVPNTTTTVVYLKEVLASPEFQRSSSPLTLPIGKDVSGRPIVADLREFPHLLIAGTTGSGKTVCINSLLVGLLSRATPDQVRFLMIDPKMVELSIFNSIPHLIAPVVTDAKKAAAALAWAVQEMEQRYQLLAGAGVRHLDGYNARSSGLRAPRPALDEGRGGQGSGQIQDPEPRTQSPEPLPYLVVVIDELADLMMASSQEVEGAITRLAQLSRAVGIHIIMATQRPSVDVVTGVIKANFSARIAFQVASKVDSRTILDMNGADKLLGRGDLLFLRPGAAKPVRAQGAFVTDAEIERVTDFLKAQGSPTYHEDLLEAQRQPSSAGGAWSSEKDELYELAKQVVLESGQASTSLLQRRLRLGYGRAARILDLMEQEGVVGPPQGSRPRDVLVGRTEGEHKTQ